MKEEGKGNTVLLTIIGIATLLVAVVGATFAYFTAVIAEGETGESQVVTIQSGTIGTELIDGDDISQHDIYPRDDAWGTKKFSLQGNNTTDATTQYQVLLIIEECSFLYNELTFTLEVVDDSSGANDDNTNGSAPVPEITELTPFPVIEQGSGITVLLGKGKFTGPFETPIKHEYALSVYFKDKGGDTAQNYNQGAILKARISLEGFDPLVTYDYVNYTDLAAYTREDI